MELQDQCLDKPEIGQNQTIPTLTAAPERRSVTPERRILPLGYISSVRGSLRCSSDGAERTEKLFKENIFCVSF